MALLFVFIDVPLPKPRTLQAVSVTVIDKGDCNKIYPGKVESNMICAGNMEGGKDICSVRMPFKS